MHWGIRMRNKQFVLQKGQKKFVLTKGATAPYKTLIKKPAGWLQQYVVWGSAV